MAIGTGIKVANTGATRMYPNNGGMFAPMMGISGMSNQDQGVSPFAQSPNGISNQQFQDPNAWLTQMLNAPPGQQTSVPTPTQAISTPTDASQAAAAPSALPANPLTSQLGGTGTTGLPSLPASNAGQSIIQQMFQNAN